MSEEKKEEFLLSTEEVVHNIKDSLCHSGFKVFGLYEFSKAIVKANDERRKENLNGVDQTKPEFDNPRS